MVQVSAEMRWFWPSSPPDGLEAWFGATEHHRYVPGGGTKVRTDLYLRDPGQEEVGIKRRDGEARAEIKSLVARGAALSTAPFSGPPEIWTKSSTDRLVLEPAQLVATAKLRSLRKLDTASPEPKEIALGADERPLDPSERPERGCNVELTRVEIDGAVWWSLGFEAFGQLETVERDLAAACAAFASRRPPPLAGGFFASYPCWLRRVLSANPA